MLLQDKVVLITGATRGIGRAIAQTLAGYGAHIAFTYKSSQQKATELENELKSLGVKAVGFQSDASDFNSAKTIVESVHKEFGKIDALINNAGITQDGLILRMTEEHWDNVLDNNLKSAFNFTKQVAGIMMRQKSGSIVNISSIVGEIGQAGQSNYAASKAGMIGFSKSIAHELGSRNIRCNAVAPGFIETEMTEVLTEDLKKKYLENVPLARYGKGEDVAELCAFLISDKSTYITGQVLNVCGGLVR